MARRASLWLLAFVLTASGVASGARLDTLRNQPPEPAGLPFLLTDGTILFQAADPRHWLKLTPDARGSYADGTWSRVADLPASWNYGPYAYASAVLADGRVLIEGGEYNLDGPFSLTNKGAIYDPVADAWSEVAPPPGWDFIGDSASIVMPNGKFLLGDKLSERIAELDPSTMSWTPLGSDGKSGFNAEEGWTLLPDGSFLAVDVHDAPNTERYFYEDAPGGGHWESLGPTPQSLAFDYGLAIVHFDGGTYDPPGETGQCMLRPDRTVFCTGASDESQRAHTAIYSLDASTWTPGPDLPEGDDAEDTSATLLPSGHVLFSSFTGILYEFDGTSLTRIGNGGGLLITLPNGQALAVGNSVRIFTPDADPAPEPAWAPAILDSPAVVAGGRSYSISGTQFNGLSQAQSFGDELQAPTNYPLVRITRIADGIVTYARTHDHSSMGVATGDLVVTTTFDVPRSTPRGASTIEVIANGIASAPVPVDVELPAPPAHSRHRARPGIREPRSR